MSAASRARASTARSGGRKRKRRQLDTVRADLDHLTRRFPRVIDGAIHGEHSIALPFDARSNEKRIGWPTIAGSVVTSDAVSR